jgi:hypothetical protein
MRKIHETMSRLYLAAKTLRGIEGPAEVARLLNESPQLVNNWERRGISSAGMLKAADTLGCRANWIAKGEEPMIESGTQTPDSPQGTTWTKKLIERLIDADARGEVSKEIAEIVNKILDLQLAGASTATPADRSRLVEDARAAAAKAAQRSHRTGEIAGDTSFSRRSHRKSGTHK